MTTTFLVVSSMVKVLVVLLITVGAFAPLLIWAERRQSAMIQDRLGPSRAAIVLPAAAVAFIDRARLPMWRLAALTGIVAIVALVTLTFGHTGLTQLVLLGDVDVRLVDCLRSCAATQCHDVSGFVFDVTDVDVDQHDTDLLEFAGHRIVHLGQERLPVLVDLLDPHRSDNCTHLTKNDVLCLIFNLFAVQSEQSDRGILHDALLG